MPATGALAAARGKPHRIGDAPARFCGNALAAGVVRGVERWKVGCRHRETARAGENPERIDLPRLVAEPFHGMCGSAVVEQDRLHHDAGRRRLERSEEHTSELQSLMRISYAVFCLKKKKDRI